ncbi:helix-turn-helix protein [Saccharothrix saharensis]|uniref:Helix-turn-helix protein n=1 Tax=Saccharothrix saharensis TaxID=571190 RepID=A0A543J5R5_9PSEU|nr:helix-turn-helix transcriptional regulator [Saccharothrix saharensis]TQM78184.1 helix-turn-helix protein [Saccharothrix saharensis]
MDDEDRHDPESARPGTARDRELGREVRLLRSATGRRAVAVAESLGRSAGWLAKLEVGRRSADARDVGALVGQLGADAATRDRIQRIVNEPRTGSFLRPNDPAADSLTALAVHEDLAVAISTYEPLIIPSLLQTEDYARAISGDEQVARIRRERQERLLHHPRGPVVHFFVHEAAVHQMVGDPRVMTEQLLTLTMWHTDNVRVRLVPMRTNGGTLVRHGSTLITLREPEPPVVVQETDTVTVFQDDPQAVAVHERKFRDLAARALDVNNSARVFARWADTYDR